MSTTFRWVAGPYDGHPDGDWEPFDADLAAVHDRYWSDSEAENPPETLTLDRLAVADIVGGEEPELVLLLQDRGYNYLVFHRESGEVCGTSFSVRWLMDLQKSGIYMGSGGADVSYYYQLSFHDGRFWGEALGEKVHAVRFTDKLKSHPVCLSTEGGLSMEMEQTLNAMPGRENRFKADVVLELNPDHPVTAKLKEYAVTDKEKLADYAKLLYAEGCLIGGVPIEEPAELCRLITGLMEQ